MKSLNDNKINISICIISYNQAGYLYDCLNSILTEENILLGIEVIIGDDNSTDNSIEVIKSFAEEYPEIIKYVLHEKNVGASKNLLSVHSISKGIYVCHVDGDDLILPNKLKVQMEILKNDKSLSFCCHQTTVFDDRREISVPMLVDESHFHNKRITLVEFLAMASSPIVHSSIMYRKSAWSLQNINFEFIDWFVIVSLLKNGNCFYIGEVLGEYRKNLNGNSMTSNKSRVIKTNCLKANLLLRVLAENPGNKKLIISISNHSFFMFLREIANLRALSARKFFHVCWRSKTIPNLFATFKINAVYYKSLNKAWVNFYK